MALKFKNSFTRVKEEFKPIQPDKVQMYTCGPTVYNYAHIGNFRAYIFEDLLRRYLQYKGYAVTQVMNLTDIDDKTIRDSRDQGLALKDFTARYIKAFFDDIDTLGIERAEQYPAATDHIPEMVALIQKLVERGAAYESGGNYYFRIASFPNYGKLANLDMEGLKPGARVASDEYEKDSVSDFALWKAWDEADGDVYWETEIGKGRPGWHIECSAMSMKYLGETFDLHTGGVDNMFPHHENEIAQSEAATGKKFVNFWLHNEFLTVDDGKMSKSLGNLFTLEDLERKSVDPLAFRYFCLNSNYRSKLNFTFEALKNAANSLEKLREIFQSLPDGGEVSVEAVEKFSEALADDLNSPKALAATWEVARNSKISAENKKATLTKFDEVLGLNLEKEKETVKLNAEQKKLFDKRAAARTKKDFKTSDEIREKLEKMGFEIEDAKNGEQILKRKS